MMRTAIGMMLLLASCALGAATVGVTNGTSVDPQSYDPTRWLVRDGNPTAPEVTAFKAGALDLVRFTSTAPVLEAAELGLDECEQAITAVCSTLTEIPVACRVVTGVSCIGQCSNSVFIRIQN